MKIKFAMFVGFLSCAGVQLYSLGVASEGVEKTISGEAGWKTFDQKDDYVPEAVKQAESLPSLPQSVTTFFNNLGTSAQAVINSLMRMSSNAFANLKNYLAKIRLTSKNPQAVDEVVKDLGQLKGVDDNLGLELVLTDIHNLAEEDAKKIAAVIANPTLSTSSDALVPTNSQASTSQGFDFTQAFQRDNPNLNYNPNSRIMQKLNQKSLQDQNQVVDAVQQKSSQAPLLLTYDPNFAVVDSNYNLADIYPSNKKLDAPAMQSYNSVNKGYFTYPDVYSLDSNSDEFFGEVNPLKELQPQQSLGQATQQITLDNNNTNLLQPDTLPVKSSMITQRRKPLKLKVDSKQMNADVVAERQYKARSEKNNALPITYQQTQVSSAEDFVGNNPMRLANNENSKQVSTVQPPSQVQRIIQQFESKSNNDVPINNQQLNNQ